MSLNIEKGNLGRYIDAEDIDYNPQADAGAQQQLPTDIAGLAALMNDGFTSLRHDMNEGFASIHREMRGEQLPDEAGPSHGRQRRNTRGRQSGTSSSR